MISNKDVTVINESDGTYYGVFLRGVSFIGKTARTASEQGLISADFFSVRLQEQSVNVGAYARQTLHTENGECLENENGCYLDLECSRERVLFLPQLSLCGLGDL